ncbi:hypothetical protein ENSA5_16320 [Enhygromyxa salina]|uniref:Uncharacterized protein n=1 Tax=Enhygromyxa salina TaxID=215803 RepID=A0A2S9YE68_9BACT|nr:hypothetical protein ENSA5_16320 [Enhygromyxa salina]
MLGEGMEDRFGACGRARVDDHDLAAVAREHQRGALPDVDEVKAGAGFEG